MHPRRRAVLSPEPAPTTPGVGASGRAGGSRQPPAPSLPRRGTRVSSGRLRPVSSYCSVSFFVLFCFFFFWGNSIGIWQTWFSRPAWLLFVCVLGFLFFFSFLWVSEESLHPQPILESIQHTWDHRKRRWILPSGFVCEGRISKPWTFFHIKKKSEINSRGRGFAFAQKRGASALCCLERCLKTTEK